MTDPERPTVNDLMERLLAAIRPRLAPKVYDRLTWIHDGDDECGEFVYLSLGVGYPRALVHYDHDIGWMFDEGQVDEGSAENWEARDIEWMAERLGTFMTKAHADGPVPNAPAPAPAGGIPPRLPW